MAVSRLPTKEWHWDGGVRISQKKAQPFGEAIERVKARVGSRFEARDVLDEARPEDSPIHDLFEWNDAVAGEKYRESQARHYIRALIVVVGEGDDARPSPVAISTGHHEGYTAIETVLDSAAMRAMMVKRALDEARLWRKRYESIKELAAVFSALDAVEQEHIEPARRGMSA